MNWVGQKSSGFHVTQISSWMRHLAIFCFKQVKYKLHFMFFTNHFAIYLLTNLYHNSKIIITIIFNFKFTLLKSTLHNQKL